MPKEEDQNQRFFNNKRGAKLMPIAKLKYLLAFLSLLAVCTSNCRSQEDTASRLELRPIRQKPQKLEPLNLKQEELHLKVNDSSEYIFRHGIPDNGCQLHFRVQPEGQFQIESLPEWCQIVNIDTQDFTLSCEANPYIEERRGTVIIAGYNKEYVTVLLQQNPRKPELYVNGKSELYQTIDAFESNATYSVQSDGIQFNIEVFHDWIAVKQKDEDSFTLTFENNKSTEPRIDSLYVYTAGRKVRVYIKQEGDLALYKWQRFIETLKTNSTRTDKGNYRKGEFTGLGMLILDQNNETYFGGQYYGQPRGIGMLLVGDAKSYDVINCPESKYYVGRWSDGVKSGNGSCYNKQGELIYNGEFIDDKPTGEYPTEGNYSIYKFELIEMSNGCYIGETKNGKPEGRGVLITEGGAFWYGGWKSGLKNGKGVFVSAEGELTAGEWINNVLQPRAPY